MKESTIDSDFEKLKEAIHFIFDIEAIHISPGTALETVSLNRILWEADTRSYIASRKSITNESYVKTLSGPIANRTNVALRSLEEKHLLEFCAPLQWFPITLLETYSPEFLHESEIDIIEESVSIILKGDIEQKDELWRLASNGEHLPLFISLAKFGEVSEKHLEWANRQRVP